MSKQINILFHVTFCFFKIGVSSYMFTLPQVTPETDLVFFTIHFATEWAITIIWFYFYYSYIIPHYLFERKYWLFFIITIAICYFNFVFKSISWNNITLEYMWWPRTDHFASLLYNTLLYITISITLKTMEYWLNSEQQKIALKEEVKSAELTYLKYQINPHFLFNTLNNIYGLSLTNNKKIVPALDQLINMIQYNDEFKEWKKITIDDEITQLNNFIELNKLRFGVTINTDFQIDDPSLLLEPMLLLPFVENAFKHGNVKPEAQINISVKAKEGTIHFLIDNEISSTLRKDNVGGIGVENIKKRLNIIYPTKHTLNVSKSNTLFHVSLILKTK